MKKLILLLALLLVVLFVPASVVADNLLKNGGFEEGIWSDLAAPDSWSHWNDSYVSPLWVNYNGWPSECRGSRGLFNGSSFSGILCQMIDFTGGHPTQSVLYGVSISGWIWIYGNDNSSPTIGNQSVAVFAGYPGDITYGELVFEQSIVSFNTGSVNNEWVHLQYTGQLETYGVFGQLCFALLSTTSTGFWYTDDWNLEVTPVPEPSPLAAICVGGVIGLVFGVFGALAKNETDHEIVIRC